MGDDKGRGWEMMGVEGHLIIPEGERRRDVE